MEVLTTWLQQYASLLYYAAAFAGAVWGVWGEWRMLPAPRPKFDPSYIINGIGGVVTSFMLGLIPTLGEGQAWTAALATGWGLGYGMTRGTRSIQRRVDENAQAKAEARAAEPEE